MIAKIVGRIQIGILTVLLTMTFASFAMECAAQDSAGAALFVAPGGRDSWSGTLSQANPSDTDGPVASLTAAVSKSRPLHSVKQIFIRQGAYDMLAPLVLGPGDDGLRIAAYRGERVTLYGGRRLERWRRSGEGFVASLPQAVPDGHGLPILLRAGHHFPFNRVPASGSGEDHEAAWAFADSSPADIDPHRAFRVRSTDDDILAQAVSGAWVSIFGRRGWQHYVLPIKQVDAAARIITLDGYTWDALGEGSRFALLNTRSNTPLTITPEAFSETAAASYWLDPVAQTLHLTGSLVEQPGSAYVVATLPCVLSAEHAHDITISGLEIAGSATGGAAICLTQTANVTLSGLSIHDTGEAIHLDAATDTHILHNVIADTAGSGIVLEHAADGTVVDGNWLHDIGWWQQDAIAIYFNGSSHARFVQNRIENVAKFAIGGGALSDGGAYDNVIDGNEIDRSNQRTSDGGAIMVIGWAQDATRDVIRSNFITGTRALGNIGWDQKPHLEFVDPATRLVSFAIYLDDWTSAVQVRGNILCDNIGGIDLHAGWDNHVSDNLLIDNAGVALSVAAEVWLGAGAHPHVMEHNLLEHNVVILRHPAGWQSGFVTVRGGPDVAQFARNVYTGAGLNAYAFHHEPDKIWPRYSFDFSAWRANAQDIDSDVGTKSADVTVRDDAVEVTGTRNAPEPFLLAHIGRPEDRAGLADRIRQRCGLR